MPPSLALSWALPTLASLSSSSSSSAPSSSCSCSNTAGAVAPSSCSYGPLAQDDDMPYPISHTPAPGDEDNNNNNNNDDNVVSKASGEAAEQRADQTPTESAVAGSHQPAYRLPGAEPSGDRHSDAIGMAKARAASPAGDTADTEHRHPPGTDSKPASEHGHGPDTDPTAGQVAAYRPKRKILLHAVVWIVATTWWVASLALHGSDKNRVVPFLLWLCLTLRIFFFYLSTSIVMTPLQFAWNNSARRLARLVPERLRIIVAAILTILVIIVGAFASPESQDNTRANRAVSLFGLAVLLLLLWATSRNRRAIQWHTVITGMLLQFIVALFVLRTKTGYNIFNFISELARNLLSFADHGVTFLTDASVAKLPWFLIGVIPAIVFFVALVQLLYHWGIVQWFVGKFAVFFFWALRVSGAEAVVAAASPFIGQGESAMLIRPFIAHLTQAELHQIMCSGFATIAGSVLVAYIGLGINPQALISSCVMSIPASLAVSKLRYPETEETLTAGRVVIPDDAEHRAANGLHAFANGAWLGLRIAGMILATLLCIIALLALLDGLLTWFGHYINLGPGKYDLTVELLAGYLCYPLAFLLGVPRNGDLVKVGRLIGIKLIANEFVAYTSLQQDPEYADLSPRSRLIATYALCGFANIGSLGTQIGVLSQLAPARAADVSRLALSALISGAISTLTSANIAGLLVTDQLAVFAPVNGTAAA